MSVIPSGPQGKLTTPGSEDVPVRVFEGNSDVLMLVMLLDVDAGLKPEPVEPVLLEYSSVQGLVRMRGEAVLKERDLIAFKATEAAEVLQRREFVRIDTAQPVVLTPEGEQTTIQTHCIDISGGGMMLRGLDHYKVGRRLRFSIELRPGEPPIKGWARIVRTVDAGHRGLIFEEISSTDRQRLIRFIFDMQRRALAMTRDGGRTRRKR